MTVQEWEAIVARIIAWWPASDIPMESLAMWFEELEPCRTEDVVAGLRRVRLRGREFAPSLGGLLAAIRQVRTGPMTRDECALTLAFEVGELPSGRL
ncbi:MAG: hypothetical protein LC798_15475 [Chloroflexi bacterium]|nr:hypothetical protein [Chloroflexota bacterium]